ncbi:TetR/AcrR family transcriptional regulator [Novosphingobium tardum]|uniref:TetR/AcrR family transcriptional regulator n=1 Tax=Novosphingobium tardum TaxID=1538021 RepID=A0ABV8RS81_9SPHN
MPGEYGTGTLAPHPDKPLLYSSPQILARRKRLLKEARHMLAEGGLDGFSIRKLCMRADVAQRTLYNAFQNKDRLIAFAIREAFDEYSTFVRDRTDPDALSGYVGRTIAINRRNFRVRNYTRAVCAIYFAPSTPRDVWETLQDMSLRGSLSWLERRQDCISPWIDREHFTHSMANVQYSTINDWCLGRLSDAEYLPRLAENMLLMLVGAVQGPLALEASAMLDDLARTGSFTQSPEVLLTPPAEPRRRAADSPEETPAA